MPDPTRGTEPWAATNSARVRWPLSDETQLLLESVRDKSIDAYPAMMTGRTVRALLRGAKTQTSRSRRWPVKPGSLLWIKETWGSGDRFYQGHDCEPPSVIAYRADHSAQWLSGAQAPARDLAGWNWSHMKWRSAMLMPRYATRLLARVTHDPYQKPIAEFDQEDVLREGCPIPADDPEGPASFDDAWEAINGERASESSAVPWVHRFEIMR